MTITEFETQDAQIITCPHCGAQAINTPAHAGEPCPLQTSLVEAQIDLLKAQAAQHLRDATR